MPILDSGERQVFKTGAIRDISKGKGRCDLLPLDVVGELSNDEVLRNLGRYQKTGDVAHLMGALENFIMIRYRGFSEAILELAIHFEEGAEKYGVDNWRGLPEWTFLSSAVRHFLKFRCGMVDENHARAFMWNILCLIAIKWGETQDERAESSNEIQDVYCLPTTGRPITRTGECSYGNK